MSGKTKRLSHFPVDLWHLLITYLPGEIGFGLRARFWRKRLKLLGTGARIDVGVYFQNPEYISLDEKVWIDRNVIILAGVPAQERITHRVENNRYRGEVGHVYIGKASHIAPNCVISGIGGLYVGRNCGIASNSTIYSFSHHYRNLEDKDDMFQYSFTPMAAGDQQAMVLGPVVIEDFCAIGLNCTVLPGTSLQRGAWVSAGATVSGSFPPQTVLCSGAGITTKDISHLEIKDVD